MFAKTTRYTKSYRKYVTIENRLRHDRNKSFGEYDYKMFSLNPAPVQSLMYSLLYRAKSKHSSTLNLHVVLTFFSQTGPELSITFSFVL